VESSIFSSVERKVSEKTIEEKEEGEGDAIYCLTS
jgi:hypothetical protein